LSLEALARRGEGNLSDGLRCTLLVFLITTGPFLASAYPEYYDISERDKAQAEVRERHLPSPGWGLSRMT
jgi:hypothetical protein